MKEIYFRGKKKFITENNKNYCPNGWVYSDTIYKDGDGVFLLPHGISAESYHRGPYDFRANSDRFEIMVAEIKPETLCQYACINDEEDQKIFENDIVEVYCERVCYNQKRSQYDGPTKVRAVVKFGLCYHAIGFDLDYNNDFNKGICDTKGREEEERDLWKRPLSDFDFTAHKKYDHPKQVWRNHIKVIGNTIDNPELLKREVEVNFNEKMV